MTEEQKRFKILKKESYEQQMSEENKRATGRTFLIGFSSALAVYSFLLASKSDGLTIKIYEGLGLLNAVYGAYQLKALMKAISKKTMLQGKIEDINTELDMPENEENRGMRI